MMRTITTRELLRLGYELFNFFYLYADKDNFEQRFADEYMFDNIGFETIEMFLFKLRVEVQKLAPHYNRLFEILNDVEVKLERGAKISESFNNKGEESVDTSDSVKFDSDTYSQEYAKLKLGSIEYDEINNAVKNIYNIINNNQSERNKADSGVKEIINNDILLHEAIENLKKVRTDITLDFVKELRKLFSYIIW